MRHLFWVWWCEKYRPYSRGGKHYRKLPVPRTRCLRGGWGYYRKPQTKNELTANHAFDCSEDREFYKIKIRRRRVNLVTNWDDIHRTDCGNHNWKRHRKHQYKD